MFFFILDDGVLQKQKYVNNWGIRSSTKSLVIDAVNQQHDNHETSSDLCYIVSLYVPTDTIYRDISK